MKFFTAIAFLAASVSFAAAQNTTTTTVPACVLACYSSALSGSVCSATDPQCLCTNSAFMSAVAACIQTSCTSASDITASVAFGTSTCAAYGITLSSSVIAAATASESSAPAASASSAAAVVSSAKASSVASSVVSSVAKASSTSSTAAAASSTAAKSAGSALRVSALGGLLGAGLLVAAAAL